MIQYETALLNQLQGVMMMMDWLKGLVAITLFVTGAILVEWGVTGDLPKSHFERMGEVEVLPTTYETPPSTKETGILDPLSLPRIFMAFVSLLGILLYPRIKISNASEVKASRRESPEMLSWDVCAMVIGLLIAAANGKYILIAICGMVIAFLIGQKFFGVTKTFRKDGDSRVIKVNDLHVINEGVVLFRSVFLFMSIILFILLMLI